jgi:hypothetical protein
MLSRGSYIVAVVLAVGVALALNLLTFAVMFETVFSVNRGISDNATEILTGWGGGIIGVIGAVVGYNAGRSSATPPDRDSDD